MVLVLGIVKASLEILGIGIGVKKVVLLMSGVQSVFKPWWMWRHLPSITTKSSVQLLPISAGDGVAKSVPLVFILKASASPAHSLYTTQQYPVRIFSNLIHK